MSTGPTRSEPPSHPDPDRAADSVSAPQGLAGLLRRVFTYGKQLIVAVRLRSACPEFPRLAEPFGTTDLRHILARISSAMGRILLLEDWFLRRAGLVHDAVPPRPRDPTPREPRQPRPARPNVAPDRDASPARPALREEASLVPTTAELAAELRGSVAKFLGVRVQPGVRGWLTTPASRIAAPDAIRLSSTADPYVSCA